MTDADRERLRRLLLERSVRFGDFTLASGRRSSYYIDCRPSTMSAEGLTLIGRLGVQAIRSRGWHPQAVGGLTMGPIRLPTRWRRRAGEATSCSTASACAKRRKSTGPVA